MCKYCTALYKALEHPCVLVSVGVLESIPHGCGGVIVVVITRLGVPKLTGNLRNAHHSSELPLYACPTGKLRKLGHASVGEDGGRQKPGRQARSGKASGSTESPEGDTHAMAPLLRM